MTSSLAATDQAVKWGLWTDYHSGRWQYLVQEHTATFCSTLLAVVLALSLPFADRLLRRFFVLFFRWWTRRESQDPARRPLLPVSNSGDPRQFIDILQAPGGGRALLVGTIRHVRQKGSRHSVLSLMIGIIILAAWVGRVIAGIFAANIVTDRTATWDSEHCGIWQFDSDGAGEGAATRADVYDREKESRAGEYARYCYESPPSAKQPMYCDFFHQRNITYTRNTTFQCPFVDESVCVVGTPAVIFDTGLVDASQIGVNDWTTYKFRRSTTCAPLNTDSRFVSNETKDGVTTFFYRYGETDDTNYTFSSKGNPFDSLSPTYDVRTYSTSLSPRYDFWRPIPELTPPTNSTIAILFISPFHIYHLKPNSDPVFGADEPCYVDGDPAPWYCKSDAKARLFACLDRQDLCSPDGLVCWSPTVTTRNKLPPSYWLMKLSLAFSNTYDSIVHRLGSALIAQEKISQYTSAPLADTHWMLEAERLFATSLARVQFDAWTIASGADRPTGEAGDHEGYVDLTPDEAGDLCGGGLFKFRSTGYKNVYLAPFLCLLILVPAGLWVLSREVRHVSWFWGDMEVEAWFGWVWGRIRSWFRWGRTPQMTATLEQITGRVEEGQVVGNDDDHGTEEIFGQLWEDEARARDEERARQLGEGEDHELVLYYIFGFR
ncbi:hypothetical protein B0H66DRAFT_565878 [Apodospora peruviana]|uniref:Uncharacterized protein n=1 Tax=Apodospora peruviana TaxID=516989 RepID=A0AAE0LZC7_9PEZI|nr:hypothetical protein B0H66DRAFT_565878 [Apodospora peruviana]